MNRIDVLNETTSWLREFLTVSNEIDRCRPPTKEEIGAARHFLGQPAIVVQHLLNLAKAIAPGSRLRQENDFFVVDVSGLPPKGGDRLRATLEHLIGDAAAMPACRLHQAFTWLSPFTDGNGRCARLLWLWHVLHHGSDEDVEDVIRDGFLLTHYRHCMMHSRYIPDLEFTDDGRTIQFIATDEAVVWSPPDGKIQTVEFAVSLKGSRIVGVRLGTDRYAHLTKPLPVLESEASHS